jgi:hypothetical protein
MATTHSVNSIRSAGPVIYFSLELYNSQWKLASTTARGQKPRLVSVPAGDEATEQLSSATTLWGRLQDGSLLQFWLRGVARRIQHLVSISQYECSRIEG